MIPVAVGIYFVFVDVLFAMVIGVLTGAVASFCLRVHRSGIVKNGLFGSLGFFVGYGACIVASPHNTSATNPGPNPYLFALVGAVFLPLLRVVYQYKFSRSHQLNP
jgi:uncharacterized membrane protein YeaQ/YmgE (transglycosylase-associated protein family)